MSLLIDTLFFLSGTPALHRRIEQALRHEDPHAS